jgi:predicted FMN-binding regulatory protein PaiB
LPASTFEPRADADVTRLVLEHPLAWIVSGAGPSLRASLLPLRPETDERGRITHLVGHFARSNEHVHTLQQDPTALVLLLGPHSYISPSWVADKTWGPTWNYVSGQFLVEVEFFAQDELDLHLRDLVGAMESGRRDAWSVEQMGARYGQLARGIVGFRARVRDARPRFKLGQDERDEIYRDMTSALRSDGRNDLLQWMDGANPARSGA